MGIGLFDLYAINKYVVFNMGSELKWSSCDVELKINTCTKLSKVSQGEQPMFSEIVLGSVCGSRQIAILMKHCIFRSQWRFFHVAEPNAF
jgi:hypothetical protein